MSTGLDSREGLGDIGFEAIEAQDTCFFDVAGGVGFEGSCEGVAGKALGTGCAGFF